MADQKQDEGRPAAGTSRRRVVGGAFALGGMTAFVTPARGPDERQPIASAAGMGAGTYRAPIRGARGRTLEDKLSEQVSILDFDVDPRGSADSTAGFRAALAQTDISRLFVPNGVYLVENLNLLGAAGKQIIGESRWQTVLRSERGADPLFASEVAARSTSSFHHLSDFLIDLNGNDSVAIDLASINMTSVERVHFRGGRGPGERVGIGVRFAAPLQKGAYDNTLYDCSFERLAKAIQWADGANDNSAYNCRVIDCDIGFDAAPVGKVNTPRVFGGRAERCRIGLREGASHGGYFDVRFEDCSEAHIEFTEGSLYPAVWAGFAAGSHVVLKNVELATSPQMYSSDLGHYQVEESDRRPKISTGRHVFGSAGKAPAVHPLRDYAAYFSDYVLLAGSASVDFASPGGEGRIAGLEAGRDGSIILSGFDRATGKFRSIGLGGGQSVRPLRDATTDFGTAAAQYRRGFFSEGIVVDGQSVVGKRQPAVADDRTASANSATVNRILAVLRAHGLIER